MVSSKPSKQRKALYTAPIHRLRKQLTATLSEDLQKQYGIARIQVRVGDVVRVMRGDHAGHEGKVIAVNAKTGRVAVEGLTRKKADGSEIPVWVHASKVVVTKLDLSDKLRKEAIERKAEQRKRALERISSSQGGT
ncbi:MAG: 50S ribosomal protein L24 [Thermoprotei archaeon]